jgi:hypothetical protein
MTANPSLLLRSHNQIEDAEDILYDLLHSLSHLSSPTKPAGENLLHWTAGILFQGLPDFDIDEKRTEQDVFEWKCGLVLLRKLIKFFLEQDGPEQGGEDRVGIADHGAFSDSQLGYREEEQEDAGAAGQPAQKQYGTVYELQINLLQAISEGETMLTSKNVIQKYNLGTSGNVDTLKKALMKKEIISFSGSKPEFEDPLFAYWFKNYYC